MKNKMVKFIFAFIVCVIYAAGVFAAPKIPEATDSFYVNDFADVISNDTADYIIGLNQELKKQTGAQIVYTTVDFIDNAEIDEFAADMFNQYGIGDKSKNNGVLVVFAIQEDNYWVAQGYGIEKKLTDTILSKIAADYLDPNFDIKDFDAAARESFDALMYQMNKIYNTTIGEEILYSQDSSVSPYAGRTSGSNVFGGLFGGLFIFFIIFAIVAFVVIISVIGSIFGGYGGYGGGYGRRPFWGGWFFPRRHYHYPRHHHPMPPNRMPPGRGGNIGGGMNVGGGGMSRGGGIGRTPSGTSRPSGTGSKMPKIGGFGSFGGGGRGFGGGSGKSFGGGGMSRGGGIGRKK